MFATLQLALIFAFSVVALMCGKKKAKPKGPAVAPNVVSKPADPPKDAKPASEKKKDEKKSEKQVKSKKSEKEVLKKSEKAAPKSKKSEKVVLKSEKEVLKSKKSEKEALKSKKSEKDAPKSKKSEKSPKSVSKKEALDKKDEKKEASEKKEEKSDKKKVEPLLEGEKKEGSKISEVKDVKDAKEVAKDDAPELPSAHMTAVQILPKELTLDPKELRFVTDGGVSKLNLTNNTGFRVAIKIKCSDNELYRINPVFAFIEKEANFSVDVSRVKGTAKPDKLAIVFTEAPKEATDAQAVFKAGPAADKLITQNVPMFVS